MRHPHLDFHPAGTAYQRFNKAVAVKVTTVVGSMTCAYIFALLALLSLPAVLTEARFVPSGFFPRWLVAAGLIALVAWIAQTFLQLVLLSVIMVGQGVQSIASEDRAARTLADTEVIMDRLDLGTRDGLTTVLVAVHEVRDLLAGKGADG